MVQPDKSTVAELSLETGHEINFDDMTLLATKHHSPCEPCSEEGHHGPPTHQPFQCRQWIHAKLALVSCYRHAPENCIMPTAKVNQRLDRMGWEGLSCFREPDHVYTEVKQHSGGATPDWLTWFRFPGAASVSLMVLRYVYTSHHPLLIHRSRFVIRSGALMVLWIQTI